MSNAKEWCVYILQCGGNRLYTGMTNDIDGRLKKHRSGKGGRFTRSFGVKRLVHRERCATKQEAMKREAQIKKMTKRCKVELIKFYAGQGGC